MISGDVEKFQAMMLLSFKKIRVKYDTEIKFEDASSARVDRAKLSALTALVVTPTNLFNFTSYIELRESSIHGDGVFALQNIPRFTLVTFYPADIAQCTPHVDKHHVCSTFSRRFQSLYTDDSTAKMRFNDLNKTRAYAMQIDKLISIHADPVFKDDVCYLGHFVNDRFKPDGAKITPAVYLQLSEKKANCAYHMFPEGLHVGIVTTREIHGNEELFATYGIDYWLGQ